MKRKGEFIQKKRERPAEVKQWFCTWPRCDIELQEALSMLKEKTQDNLRDWLIAREHHEDGGIHLHAYLMLKKKRYFKPDMFDLGEHHGHYDPCKNYKKVIQYCKKEEDYICNFAIELTGEEKVAMRNKELLTGDLDELVNSGKLSVFSVPQIKKARDILAMSKLPPKVMERKCYWIYGKPRIGKSWLVRQAFDAYVKAQNKWWDGYNQEEVVLLDDFDDKGGKVLGHHIKIWADNYRFIGEFKGGSCYPTYKKFIVTSNYQPYQIWDDDKIMSSAIASRFKMIEMTEREQQQDIIKMLMD